VDVDVERMHFSVAEIIKYKKTGWMMNHWIFILVWTSKRKSGTARDYEDP
jgi:hypothetical protein